MTDLIIRIASRILELFELVLLVRCILSFFGYNKFYDVLCKITEPVLSPLRRVLDITPLGGMRFDFSPVVAMLLIGAVERCLYLVRILF